MAKRSLRQKQLKQEVKGCTDISQPWSSDRGDEVTLTQFQCPSRGTLLWVDVVSAEPFRPLESWERWVKAEHT